MDATEGRPFGALLRAYRVGAGLSQEELAERARLSRRTISDLERGVTTAPYRDTLALLADALELGERDRAALEDAVHRARSSPAANQEPDRFPSDLLLATKLAIPSARAALVPRPRLVERLRVGTRGPLTLLSAPAGSGKTTLLSAWHVSPEVRDLPLAWVSLDLGDNDPTRFWRYVLTALNRAAPGVGAAALTLPRSADALSMETVLGALINAVTARAEDIVLILDDYHLIDAAPIHRMLTFLIEHLPPCLHLLLATRADPPLPLARLRAGGGVTELRAADLRFSVEETAAFLGPVMGLSLSSDEVASLEARTEGWIAGLQLAGLSLRGRPSEEAAAFIAAFTGSHRYIMDYLLDEVLLRQPEHVWRFLLHTCILDRLRASLCAAVIEGADPSAERIAASQEVIELLERHNVFLIALDEERCWYRYHYLFADALRQRQIGDAMIIEAAVLHQRASAWFEQQGLLEEAIGHALAGGGYDRAADLIGRIAGALAARGEMRTLSAWLRALPETTLRARPQLCIMYAWLLVDMRDMQGAEEYLRHAEAALEAIPRQVPSGPDARNPAADAGNPRAVIAAGWAIILAIRGDAIPAISRARAALDGLDDADIRSRSLATFGLGLAHLSQGSAPEAAAAFRDLAAINQETSFSLFMVLAIVGQACAYRLAGALDSALAVYDQAIARSTEQAHPSLLAGSLYTGMADILRERNDLEAALGRATQGIKLSNDLGAARTERWVEWHVCDLLVLARIKQAQGDLDGALMVVKEAREQLEGFGAISFIAVLAAFEAQLHLARGDLDAAIGRLRSVDTHEAPPRFGLTPQFFVYASEHLELAPSQVLLAQGRATGDPAPVRRALALLDQGRVMAERADLVWSRAKILTLQALAHQALADMPRALAPLEQALALAQPHGYIRLFIDEGPFMADLLRQSQPRGKASDYVAKLLDTFNGHGSGSALGTVQSPARSPASRADLPAAEPLTERELDVLRLLAAGLANPEIARTLYIEVNTVKTHVKNLYGKLGVHSRVQVAKHARERGLL
ncbi:MAG TPA: LuxR C-terminal-related transcriptional regulator [Chloroflexota bacterium]|nr:LuxR C-terminal-related transcriptional regulator [Chloroflexota bacterium]